MCPHGTDVKDVITLFRGLLVEPRGVMVHSDSTPRRTLRPLAFVGRHVVRCTVNGEGFRADTEPTVKTSSFQRTTSTTGVVMKMAPAPGEDGRDG